MYYYYTVFINEPLTFICKGNEVVFTIEVQINRIQNIEVSNIPRIEVPTTKCHVEVVL